MIIEDEPFVRSTLHAMFRRDGFEVYDAGPCINPDVPRDCALQCCAENAAPDLAVIAVVTPRLCSGVHVARKVLSQWPNVRILLISASAASAWPLDALTLLDTLPRESFSFLEKPFTVSQLRDTVERLLGQTVP